MFPRSLSLALSFLLAACQAEKPEHQFQGYAEGDYLHLGAPQSGWLQSVPVHKGDRVAVGDTLFVLEAANEEAAVAQANANLAQMVSQLADLRLGARPEEIKSIEAQLEEAEANLQLARSAYQRQLDLSAQHVATQVQLDTAQSAQQQAEARRDRILADLDVARLPARPGRIEAAEAAVEAAKASLHQAEWRLSQRKVISPVDGVVDDIVRIAGEWVPGSGTVVNILPSDGTKVVFFVPEVDFSQFKLGDEVHIGCSQCVDSLMGRISRIATNAEYTPPVIYSRDTKAKLVWRMEATLKKETGSLTPGQPVIVLAQHP